LSGKKLHAAATHDERHQQRPRSNSDAVKCKKALQGTPPRGVFVKKIYRKKFSWKNYAEVSAILLVVSLVH
jgi:hypothetical protein